MPGDKIPRAPHLHYSNEHKQEPSRVPCVAAEPVPLVKPSPENVDETKNPVDNPSIDLAQPSQATLEEPSENDSLIESTDVFDCETIHAPAHYPPMKGRLLFVDQSLSIANLNEPTELEREVDATMPFKSQPSFCLRTTTTNRVAPMKTFLQNSEAPTIGTWLEDTWNTKSAILGPSPTTSPNRSTSPVEKKTQTADPALQPPRATLLHQKAHAHDDGKTEMPNSRVHIETLDETITTSSDIDLHITGITQFENSSESSEESVGTTQSRPGGSKHPKVIVSGEESSNGSSKSSTDSGTTLECTTNEPAAVRLMRTDVVYRAAEDQFIGDTNRSASDSDSLENAKPTVKYGTVSTKKEVARMFKTPSRRNATILIWDAIWSDFEIISRILRRPTKKLILFTCKIVGVVLKVLGKLLLAPLKIIKLLRNLLRSSMINRALAEFRRRSVGTLKFVVHIVKLVVRVLRVLSELLRRRIIPAARRLAAKTYCTATSLFLFLMYICQGSVRVGHLRITSKFIHDGFINPFALHDLLGVSRDDVFTVSSPPVSSEGMTQLDMWRGNRWAENYAHSVICNDTGSDWLQDSKTDPSPISKLH